MAVEEPHPQQYHVNTWFFVCGPLAMSTFVLGLAANVHVFKKYKLAFDTVLDMRAGEVPSARGLAQTAAALFALQLAIFHGVAWHRGAAFDQDETRIELLLVLYLLGVTALLFWPQDIFHRKFRLFVRRKLARILWPFQRMRVPANPTPFIEVFLADGLTSLSKFIQDAAIALSLLAQSFVSEPEDLRESYISKLKQSPLPYLAASLPYIIRATQCLISFHRTASANDRFLHLLNTMKYCSSLLVICVGAYPQVLGLARPEQNEFFLLCAVFNSMYSFLWDVIMDWGLGQPQLPRRVMFLRHQLTYRPRRLYYAIIVLDFGLRIMWVTKWWDWMHRGVHFKLVSQVAEVLRRVVWNCVRVEWQCIKLEILGTKKLSEDSLELEQSIESMPLMNEEDSDEGDTKPRMRTLSRANSVVMEKEDSPATTASAELGTPSSVQVHVDQEGLDEMKALVDKSQSMLDNDADQSASTHMRKTSSPESDELNSDLDAVALHEPGAHAV